MGAPIWSVFLSQVHDDDEQRLTALVDECFSTGEEFSTELRFYSKTLKEYVWLYLKARLESIQQNNDSVRVMSGIMFDITARKQNEENLIKANQKMLSMARQPGMAEIATYILHNIGNILNSANVSMSIIKENMEQPYFDKLLKVFSMFE